VGIRRFLILITAALIIILALGIWFYPSNEDFRTENPLWNGVKAITSDLHIRPLGALANLPPLSYGATLIVIPYLDFKTAELEKLRSFAEQGGSLILADDYGYGNRVLTFLGLEARFTGEVLLDPLVNYKNKQFPRIVHLQPDTLTAHTDNIVFNHATSLAGVAGAEVLAVSSPFSFLDLNDNGVHEDNEPSGPLPVISRHRLGEGQVILISDPSLFINTMSALEGNAALMQNIAASSDEVYIDQSHLTQSELHRTRNRLQKARDLASTPAGTSGLVIISMIASLMPIWHKKKEPAG
jgi:hypothetical protein